LSGGVVVLLLVADGTAEKDEAESAWLELAETAEAP